MIMKSKGETWNPEEKIVNKNRKSALMDLSPSTAVNNHKSYIEKPVENNTKNLNTKQLTAGESSTDTTHSIIDEKAITSTTQNPHSSNQIANPPSSSSNSKYTIGPPHSLNSAVENTASPDVRKAKLKPHGLLISSGKRESGEPGSPGGPLSSPKSAGPLNHQQQPPVPQSPKTADQDKKAGGGGFFSMFKKPKDDDTSDYVDPTSNNNTPQARKKSAFKETIAKFLPGSTAMNTEQSESWAALMVQKNAPSNDGNQGAPTSLQNSPASVSKSSGMLSMGRKKSTSVSTAGPPTDFNAPPVPAILSHPITGNTSAETPKSPAAEKSGGGIFSRKKANSTAGSNIPDMAKLVAETTSTNTANTTTSSASAATKSNFLGFHMRKKSLSSGAQDAPVPDSFIAAPPVPKLPAVVAAGPTDTISPTSPTLTDIQLKKLSMIGQGGRKTNYVVQSVDSLDTETSPVIKNEVFADGDLGTSNNKRQSSIRPKSVIVLSSKTNSEILLSISPSPPPQKSPVEHTSSSNESRRQNFSNLNEKRKKAFSTAALDEIDGLPSPTSPKGSVDALEISASNDITGKKGSILAIISGKKKATSAQEVQEANAAESQPVNEEKPRRRR